MHASSLSEGILAINGCRGRRHYFLIIIVTDNLSMFLEIPVLMQKSLIKYNRSNKNNKKTRQDTKLKGGLLAKRDRVVVGVVRESSVGVNEQSL